MNGTIAVASQNFGPKYQGLVYAQLRKALRPGQTIVECATLHATGSELVAARLAALLELDPRPIALVGICIRPDAATVDRFRAAEIPVVLIDEQVPGASTVSSDNRKGGSLAGRHFAQAGRSSIAIVSGPVHDYNARLRLLGFQEALAEHGLPLPPENQIEASEYSQKDGAAALARLLHVRGRVDAVFCAAGDACAVGMLSAAHKRQIRIPDELAILGYDDSPLASISDPPLSTIQQPLERIAREALQLVGGDPARLLAEPREILVAPQLVLRRTA